VDGAILNDGLALSMDFGPDWLEPIQARLAKLHPELSKEQLDAYDARCRSIRDAAQARVAALARRTGDPDGVYEAWAAETRAEHSWISEPNLRHLYSQARYYMHKGALG
jgi:hypothetical protein